MQQSTYAVMDETGTYPLYITNGFSQPEGSVEIGYILPEVLSKMMFVEGVWVDRPSIPDFTITKNEEGTTLETTVPEGTVCTVHDVYSGALLAELAPEKGIIQVTLPEAGVYSFDFVAPKPTLSRVIEVEI